MSGHKTTIHFEPVCIVSHRKPSEALNSPVRRTHGGLRLCPVWVGGGFGSRSSLDDREQRYRKLAESEALPESVLAIEQYGAVEYRGTLSRHCRPDRGGRRGPGWPDLGPPFGAKSPSWPYHARFVGFGFTPRGKLSLGFGTDRYWFMRQSQCAAFWDGKGSSANDDTSKM